MAKKNPPRKTTIRGQRHLLAYITPDEAALLKANGGTGEAGPMGIPSYPPVKAMSGPGVGRAGPSKDGPKGAGKPGGTGGKSTPGGAKGSAPQKTHLESLIELATFNPVAAIASEFGTYMKGKIQKGLTVDTNTPVTYGGKITGYRDEYGRLTGRDPAQEKAKMASKDGPDFADKKQKQLALQQKAVVAESKKEVIKTDLAKEIEAERLKGRKLGKRSLLSNLSTLGA